MRNALVDTLVDVEKRSILSAKYLVVSNVGGRKPGLLMYEVFVIMIPKDKLERREDCEPNK